MEASFLKYYLNFLNFQELFSLKYLLNILKFGNVKLVLDAQNAHIPVLIKSRKHSDSKVELAKHMGAADQNTAYRVQLFTKHFKKTRTLFCNSNIFFFSRSSSDLFLNVHIRYSVTRKPQVSILHLNLCIRAMHKSSQF